WRLRHDPALRPALVDDGMLYRFDADGVVVDVQRTGGFARRGAHAACELGKVVGRMQHVQRAAPVLLVDQIIPVGDDVVDGAAAGAERYAAIHAARTLLLGFVVRQCIDELAPVFKAHERRFVGFFDALEFKKAGNLAHYYSSGSNLLWVGRAPEFAQGTAVLDRHDLDEGFARLLPIVQHVARTE